MFLMPAPGGVIFTQDYGLCCEVIKKIQDYYKNTLKLVEKQRLENYLEHGKEKHHKYSEQLMKISQKLQEEGFTVIPLPGVFYDDESMAVNFLNSIVGIGKEEKFCITNGSSHPVDRYLRDAFTAFLNNYGIQHVYFTGRKTVADIWNIELPTNKFAEADHGLMEGGGIHCRTQTLPVSFKDFNPRQCQNPSPTLLKFLAENEYVGETLPQFYVKMLKYMEEQLNEKPKVKK